MNRSHRTAILFASFVIAAALRARARPEVTADSVCEIAGAMCARTTNRQDLLVLPLKQTDVRIEVTAGITRATVVQRFENDTPYPLEAVYIFPLPAQATVTDMQLRIGDRLIRSVVQERAQAKETYEKAKQEGRKAALVEQERPNIFTTSVANFRPGESVEVTLAYMQATEYRKGVYAVTYPMVVGQRYIPFKVRRNPDATATVVPGVDDAHRLNPPVLHPAIDPEHRLSMEVELFGLPVDSVTCSTHAVRVDRPGADGPVRVTLAREVTIPNSDFHIDVHLRPSDMPATSFVTSATDDATYGLLTVFPPSQAGETAAMLPRDVVFLIDTSGSMSGESIGQARAGLKRCMQMLRAGDRFTIVRFASDYSAFAPDFRDVSDERMEAATAYIDGLTADGGTEMQKALEYVLSFAPRDGAMPMVVFLTDGDVGNEESLMQLLSKELGRGRLFTFGIGSAPNEFLMRKMAEVGRGQCRFIHSHEDIGTVMADFFKTLASPVLTDIAVEWKDMADNTLAHLEAFPSPCPDVFHERPLQLLARFPEARPARAVVTGRMGGQAVRFDCDVCVDGQVRHEALEKMFGGRKIDHLMFELLRAQPDAKKSVEEAILATALEHQLVSKYTSRVAVEERVERKPDGSLVSVKVPTPLPRGWNPAKFCATATDDWLWLAVAAILLLAGCALLFVGRAILPGHRLKA